MGLKEGEKVVTVGQFYLKENDKVRSTSKSDIGEIAWLVCWQPYC